MDCCHGCVPPKRSAICHSICEEYKKEVEERSILNAEIRKQRSINAALNQLAYNRYKG